MTILGTGKELNYSCEIMEAVVVRVKGNKTPCKELTNLHSAIILIPNGLCQVYFIYLQLYILIYFNDYKPGEEHYFGMEIFILSLL